ncbi:MAG: hypothetical protein IMZ65_01055 [Planctomycetes bacterium]|nr:hypothetical protein [Planctomycetota bacterium]
MLLAGLTGRVGTQAPTLALDGQGCFEARGVNVLVSSYVGNAADALLR